MTQCQTIPDDITALEAKELLLAEPDYPPWWYLAHPNAIPAMVHPMGKYWMQPKASRIAVTDKHAFMSQSCFEELRDYSQSQPTGCYPGKMWRAHYLKDGWWLLWFAYSEKGATWCSVSSRQIVIKKMAAEFEHWDDLPEERKQEIRTRNNPQCLPTGAFTGRCMLCGSTDLWEDVTWYGCNCCGKWYPN